MLLNPSPFINNIINKSLYWKKNHISADINFNFVLLRLTCDWSQKSGFYVWSVMKWNFKSLWYWVYKQQVFAKHFNNIKLYQISVASYVMWSLVKWHCVWACCKTCTFAWLQVRSLAGLGGSVGCASDWWSGGCGFDPRRLQNSFVEIDHETFSTVILSHPLIQEGQWSAVGEMCKIQLNRL